MNKTVSMWDLSHVRDYLTRTQGCNLEEAKIWVEEYRKYISLKITHLQNGGEELPLGASKVDKAWHAHILFTEDYLNMCDEAYGSPIHHRPYEDNEWINRRAEYLEVTLGAYRKAYGEPNRTIWPIS